MCLQDMFMVALDIELGDHSCRYNVKKFKSIIQASVDLYLDSNRRVITGMLI